MMRIAAGLRRPRLGAGAQAIMAQVRGPLHRRGGGGRVPRDGRARSPADPRRLSRADAAHADRRSAFGLRQARAADVKIIGETEDRSRPSVRAASACARRASARPYSPLLLPEVPRSPSSRFPRSLPRDALPATASRRRPSARASPSRELEALLREDYAANARSRLKWTFFTPGFQAILAYRLGVWCNGLRPGAPARAARGSSSASSSFFVRNFYGIELYPTARSAGASASCTSTAS